MGKGRKLGDRSMLLVGPSSYFTSQPQWDQWFCSSLNTAQCYSTLSQAGRQQTSQPWLLKALTKLTLPPQIWTSRIADPVVESCLILPKVNGELPPGLHLCSSIRTIGGKGHSETSVLSLLFGSFMKPIQKKSVLSKYAPCCPLLCSPEALCEMFNQESHLLNDVKSFPLPPWPANPEQDVSPQLPSSSLEGPVHPHSPHTANGTGLMWNIGDLVLKRLQNPGNAVMELWSQVT